MTKAVRLHHPTLKNCVFTIEQQSRIYPTPYQCAACEKTHIFKTFHLNLNEHGNVAVSEEIYDLFIREGIVTDLRATKEVTPAPTVLDMARKDKPQIIIAREHGPVRLPGMNGHGQL